MSNSKLLLAKISSRLLECFIITIILSLVIFLLDHPIKYMLFIFGLSLTWLLFLTTWRYDYKIKSSIAISSKHIDYFFLVCSTIVLASNIFSNHIMNIIFIPSVIVSFFLPGWVLLRLLKIDCIQRTNVGLFVLSFCISIGLTSLVYIFALPFKTTSTAAIILSVIYVIISLLPLFKDNLYKRHKSHRFYSSNHKSEYNLFDILLLAWLTLFFIFVISNLYPQMAYVPGNDIIRHFSYAKELILAPHIFFSEYPWFHISWATVNELSAPPIPLFQSGVAYLSAMLIFSFYIMAKEYLSDIDARAPVLATVFFVVFSGFGWIYFMQHVLDTPNPNEHWNILNISAHVSYSDIGFGQVSWLWLWFRPITLGFTIFFVLLYLMRHGGLTKLNYIIISSLLILILSQVHFSELIIFVALLFILALLFPTIKLRLKETAISVLIGLAAAALLTAGYQNLLGSDYRLSSNQYLFVLAALAGLVFILVQYSRRPRISFRMDLTALTPIALFVYFIILFYWLSNADGLKDPSEILAVPLEFYPVLLGIAGVFAIPCFILLAKKYTSDPVVIFGVLFILIVIFGRTITYINASIESTGYWERRLIPFTYVSASVLSSIIVLKVISYLKQQQQQREKYFRNLKNILTVTFLSSVVLGGVLSTFLSVEYQILNVSRNALPDNEINNNILSSIDPDSTLLTLSERSHAIAEYASVDYLVGYYKYQLWPSTSPELPLNILYSLNNSVIIYLNEEDLKQITYNNTYRNSYIASHLLKMASTTKKGFAGGDIIQTPRLAPTSSSSDMVLVLPEGGATLYNYAYDILSLGGYKYTSVLLSDIDSISKARIVVVPSEQIALKVMHYKSKYNLQYEKLIVLNIEGYGQLVDVGRATFSPLIAEDNTSAKWMMSGIGSGKIGIPKFIDNNPDINISGKNSLGINIGAGEYGLWQISLLLDDKPLNLTKFDFVRFNWYGRGDGKWYALQFTSEPGRFFWYRFQDSWSGWRQVILPMQMTDGSGHISGVTFDKATAKQGASWTKITRIDFRTEASNINNKGEFYLDGFGFGLGNMLHSSGIKWISNNKEIQFSTDVDLYPIIPKSNYDIIAYYNIGVPFILHKTYNSYDMFYLNVQPIIQKMNSEGNDARYIYPLLDKLLEDMDIKLPAYKFISRDKNSLVTGGVVAFNNATFSGDLSFESSSAIIDVNSDSIRAAIDGNNLILNGISQVLPINIENVTVNSDGGVIKGGSGFYTDVSLMNQSSILFRGNPAILSLSFKDGSKNTTISGKEIQINLAKSNVLLREPTVASNGIINFDNFYGYGEMNDKIRVLGKDLRIDGKVTFNITYSGIFTITRGFSLEGNLIRSDPIYHYDELGSLANIFSLSNIRYVLTLLLIFVVFNFYIFNKKKSGVPIKTK